MKYEFFCCGHENITSKHKNTLEFTKDLNVTLSGECIVGVKADFSLERIKEFIPRKIKNNENRIPIKVIIKINNYVDEINGFLNVNFDDSEEIVIRKSDFVSGRTLVVKADKGAKDLNKNLIKELKNPDLKIKVILE
ncbi:DUF371 domain-containing protein [Candidatus Woesearchaeota archaeon]|nr:DUF371 domain-containing protein [Candidatus Woesearchaeota archaeon]